MLGQHRSQWTTVETAMAQFHLFDEFNLLYVIRQ